MEITFDAKQLTEVLQQITSVTGAENATLSVDDGKLYVTAKKAGQYLRKFIPAESDKNGNVCTFAVEVVKKICDKRGQMRFMTDSKDPKNVKFKAANTKYQGDFVILPFEDTENDFNDAGKEVKMKSELQRAIRSYVKKILIMDVYDTTGTQMEVVIHAGKTGLEMACYDQYHLAYIKDTQVTHVKELDIILPISVFDKISLLVGDSEKYSMTFGENAIAVKAENFDLIMPTVSSSMNRSITVPRTFVSNIGKADATVSLQASLFRSSMDSIVSVQESGMPMLLRKSKKGQAVIAMKSNYGNVSESHDESQIHGWKDDTEYKLDPNLVMDLIRLVEDKTLLKLSFVKGKFMYIPIDNLVYACNLM